MKCSDRSTNKTVKEINSDEEYDKYRDQRVEHEEEEDNNITLPQGKTSKKCTQTGRTDPQKIRDILHVQRDILNRLDKNDRMLQEILTTVKEMKNIIPMVASGMGGTLQRHDIFSPLNMPN